MSDPRGGEHLAARLDAAMAAQRDAGRVYEEPPVPDPVDEQAARRAAWADAIPARFADARLDTLPTTPAMAQLRVWCQSGDGRNLILCGPAGTGKTWAATAAARCRFGNGQSVAWWSVVRLLRALRPGGDDQALADAESVGVLLLDDLAAHKASDWTDEQLYGLVDHRWSNRLPVIATSNVMPDNADRAMDERLFSRLFGDEAVVLTTGGPDRRMST